MKVLVLNCGSSSVKFQLVDTSLEQIENDTEERLAEGAVTKIGLASASVTYRVCATGHEFEEHPVILEHEVALRRVVELLTEGEDRVVESPDEITAVGHRMVHGGEEFSTSVLIDAEVLEAIERCTAFAPLHNPHNLRGYRIVRELLPGRPHCAVFDTAFHQTMPREAYLYGLPWSIYEKHDIRRFGFHGTSHRFVHFRLARVLRKTKPETSAITIHLGNGCSMTAIREGRSIDTSMGFTPLEGLIMGTRCGDLDPAVILHIMEREEVGLHEASGLMNKFSGLAGLSGVSSDMRQVLAAAKEGNDRARAAVEVFAYRVKKYLGAYLAALGCAPDGIVFTGGIGENAAEVRLRCASGLEHLGITLDEEKNAAINSDSPPRPATPHGEHLISAEDSRIGVWVIPTDEERVIARDTVRALAAREEAEVGATR